MFLRINLVHYSYKRIHLHNRSNICFTGIITIHNRRIELTENLVRGIDFWFWGFSKGYWITRNSLVFALRTSSSRSSALDNRWVPNPIYFSLWICNIWPIEYSLNLLFRWWRIWITICEEINNLICRSNLFVLTDLGTIIMVLSNLRIFSIISYVRITILIIFRASFYDEGLIWQTFILWFRDGLSLLYFWI
jgi:hypothetical protein